MKSKRAHFGIIFATVMVISACGMSNQPVAISGDTSGAQTGLITGGTSVAGSGPVTKDMGIAAVAPSAAIIRSGDLSLQTKNVEKVFTQVKELVTKYEGRVETSTVQGRANSYGPTAYLTLRVPESQLDAVVEAITKLGKRNSLSLNTSDVTLQKLDLQAKVDALIESKTRLQNLLDKTTSTSELIAGEQAMATLQSELDGYQSQLDYLKNQVAESTLNVSIISDDSSITSGLKSIKEMFLEAARGFLEAFQKSFVFIVTAIPWVLVFGLLFFGTRFLVRFIAQLVKRRD